MNFNENILFRVLIALLFWPGIIFLFALIFLDSVGGHGPQFIILYLAPILGIVGGVTHASFICLCMLEILKLKYIWLWISIVTFILYIFIAYITFNILGIYSSESTEFYLIFAVRLGILPALIIPLVIEKILKLPANRA